MTSHLVSQDFEIDRAFRARLLRQRPCLLWFTGLSGSGKSTVSGLVERELAMLGVHTYLLDGDNVRQGLCKDLSFSASDRKENIRRIGEVGKLMVDAGLVVLTAFISPFREDRDLVRAMFGEDEFIEIHVDASLPTCEERDAKGLYKKARSGLIPHFTGIDSPYEKPLAPEIRLDTEGLSIKECVSAVTGYLKQRHIVSDSR
jgi:adenylylsulfate kinase